MIRFCLVLACLLGLNAPAWAATFTYMFQGTVTALDQPGGQGLFGAPGTASVGNAFSGTFSYTTGPGNPNQFGNTEVGRYTLDSFSVNESSLTFTPTSVLVQTAGILNPPPPDRLRIGADVNTSAYGGRVALTMTAPTGTLPDGSLPAPIPAVFFNNAVLSGVNLLGEAPFPDIGDIGEITSISLVTVPEVPIPPSIALFGTALILLGARGRRSIRQR